MSGINRQILGDLTKQKKSGKALVSALGSAFSPKNIMKTKAETQPLKKKGKK